MTVREDDVLRPDGAAGIYGVVEMLRSVGVLALTSDEAVVLVGQWRYPFDQWSWEIVEGGVHEAETDVEAAHRELKEEAGLVPGALVPLGGEVHLSNACTNERSALFVATDLQSVEAQPDPTEVLELRQEPLEGCLRMVDDGEIQDALSIIALLRFDRARRRGRA